MNKLYSLAFMQGDAQRYLAENIDSLSQDEVDKNMANTKRRAEKIKNLISEIENTAKPEKQGGWVHILARKPSDDDQQYYFIRGKKSYSMLVVQWDFENQEFILPDDAPTNHFSESNLYWLDEDEIEWEDLDD